MTTPMHIVERRIAGVTILRLSGRLELGGGDCVLRDQVNQLVEQGRLHLVIDMTDVTRLDSAGIGMLVSKFMTVKTRGGSMKLLHLTARTSRLLHLTRLATVFETFDDEDTAVQSFGAAD